MWLKTLEADRLRNLRAVQLDLGAGLTVIAGRNAQGKTSLLEAAHLLATGRSFRTRRSDDLISWDGGPLRVAGTVHARVGRTGLTVVIDGPQRSLLVDGQESPDLESFIGRLNVIDLTADRMKVVRGGPEDRRKFLDRGIVGLEPSFLRVIGEYRKVLQQRNALLRQARGSQPAELNVWDERLVAAAVPLHRRRREYAVSVAAELGEISRILFPRSHKDVHLHYRPSPAEAGRRDPSKFPEIFAESLRKGRERDLGLGHTFMGPHRDDLRVDLDEMDLLRFGSAGQVRASMVALKLGKLSLIHRAIGETPLFLMDDFDSDLDEVRASDLAGYLNEAGFQALVATSKEAMAEGLGVPFQRIKVDEGVAVPESSPR